MNEGEVGGSGRSVKGGGDARVRDAILTGDNGPICEAGGDMVCEIRGDSRKDGGVWGNGAD